MNVGVLITVRSGSTRLPQKALKKVKGYPIISYLISRLKLKDNGLAQNVICTTTLPEDTVFDQISQKHGILCYHGDPDNIIKRHYQCAKEFGFDFIVNIDGDDIFCNPEYTRKIIQLAKKDVVYDVIKTLDLPFGTNVMGYRIQVLERILQKYDSNKIETGWGELINNKQMFLIKELKAKEVEKLEVRLTLDYEEDFCLFKSVIESIFPDNNVYLHQQKILDFIRKNPQLGQINQHLNEIYWSNFNAQKIEKI